MNKIVDGIKQMIDKQEFLKQVKQSIENKSEYIFISKFKYSSDILYVKTNYSKVLKHKRYKTFNGENIVVPFTGGKLILKPEKYSCYIDEDLIDFTFSYYKEQILKDIKERNKNDKAIAEFDTSKTLYLTRLEVAKRKEYAKD
jgi:hypothetical protein